MSTRAFALLAVSGTLLASVAALAGAATVAGWIERARLGAEGVQVWAKLDTGADSSSLHAKDVRWFVRDEADWVAFEVEGLDGRKVRFERKVVRIARVRRPTGEVQRRPTVLLGVCVGDVYRVTEVNLTDRSAFDYPMLIGRRFLAGEFIVDSSRAGVLEPRCPEAQQR
jgi:hypothetical protein